MAQMRREVEIKFPLRDAEGARGQLRLLGATRVDSVFEDNMVFDGPGGSLRSRGELLRLRRDRRNTLTFKSPLPHPRFKVRHEVEVEVSDLDQARLLLESLGFQVVRRYQKERESWRYGDLAITVDRLPFGCFLELEGPEQSIAGAAAALGLDLAQGITQDYLALYEDYCRERGIVPGDLVF